MGKASGVDLLVRRFRAGIWRRDRTIDDLQRQIRRLKTIIYEMCDRYTNPLPDLRYGHYVPTTAPITDDTPVDEEEPSLQPALADLLISEIVRNEGKRKRRYFVPMKKFWSLVFLRSPGAYETISQVLPIPQPQTIARFVKSDIAEISESVQSLDGAIQTLRRMKQRYSPSEPILCAIGVDACSHEEYLFQRQKEQELSLAKEVKLEEFLQQFGWVAEEEKPEVHKYCFLFYLMPLNKKIPCTPLYICSERTGKAGNKHSDILYRLAEAATTEGFTVAMLCSDGDNEYYSHQRDSYGIVRHVCGCFDEMDDVTFLGRCLLQHHLEQPLFGADMLHLLKNARTRLLGLHVSLNTRYPESLNLEDMKRVLNLPEACFRDAPLNKMMDALPLFIFTMKNSLKLFDEGLIQESMFVLVFAMFQGFFRAKCGILDRIGMGITFLRTIDRYMTYVNYTLSQGTCRCLEYRRPGVCVTMFPMIHMERMTVTVAVVLGLILALPNDTKICLNRCSTHPLENFFGTLRTYCGFKHSYSNISNKVARTQILRSFKEELGIIPCIRSRVSVAGQQIVTDKANLGFIDTDYSLGIMCMIDGAYAQTRLNVEADPAVSAVIRRFLSVLADNIELPNVTLTGKYSGMQIMNRLIANSQPTG